ncbi:hypothetical protein LJK88_36975 [Paenibacillus sp. P26]|nr:hypothetical protein LJK88_36975 [Paenibacillus sp. P26]
MLPSLVPFGTGSSNGLTENNLKFKFKDQYGEDFDKDYTGYEVEISFSQTAGTVANNVYFSKGSFSGTPTWVLSANPASGYPNTIAFTGDDTRVTGYSAANNVIRSIRDSDLTFTPVQGKAMKERIKLRPNCLSRVRREVFFLPLRGPSS